MISYNDEINNKILKGLAEGKSRTKIAKEVGLTSITYRIRKMEEEGVENLEALLQNNVIDNRILKELLEGKTQTEIAKELGLTKQAISRRIKKMRKKGVKIPEVQKKPRKMENDATDNKILSGLEEGKTQTKIAKDLGRSQTSVSKRIKRMMGRGIEIPKAPKKPKKMQVEAHSISEFNNIISNEKISNISQAVQDTINIKETEQNLQASK